MAPIRGRVAVVVGIPTREEAATIRHVASAAEAGLRDAGLEQDAVLVNADNDSADGTSALFLSAHCSVPRAVISTGADGTGKGTNILAILGAAQDLDAQRVVMLDGDVRTVEPHWVGRMLEAVAGDRPTMAVPVYRRDRYEGTSTNHIVSPLLAAVFGVHVQQPIAGDFAFNRAFIDRAMEWPVPDSARLYGIDVHLSANAARQGHGLVEVPLGRKIHSPGFPKILTMSQQVIDSLFHVIAQIDRPHPAEPRAHTARSTVDLAATRPAADLVRRTVAKALGYVAAREDELRRLFPSLDGLARASWGFEVQGDAWAELLADALAAAATGATEAARDGLVALLLCRVMTYWRQIESLRDPDEIDAVLDLQTAAVVEAVARRRLRFSCMRPTPRFDAGYWADGGS